MPHVTIKTYPISEKEKIDLSQEIIKAIVKTTGKPEGFISISITDVPESEWMEKVYEKEIKPEMDSLYKKPGY